MLGKIQTTLIIAKLISFCFFFLSFALPAHQRGHGFRTPDPTDIVSNAEFQFSFFPFTFIVNGVVVLYGLISYSFINRYYRRVFLLPMFILLTIAGLGSLFCLFILSAFFKVYFGPKLWATSVIVLSIIATAEYIIYLFQKRNQKSAS